MLRPPEGHAEGGFVIQCGTYWRTSLRVLRVLTARRIYTVMQEPFIALPWFEHRPVVVAAAIVFSIAAMPANRFVNNSDVISSAAAALRTIKPVCAGI